MTYSELTYTEPYLMSLHPDCEMDAALLCRPEVHRAIVEYGPTPALGHFVEAERFELRGLRRPAENGRYADHPEDNPELPVVQFIAHLTGLEKGSRVYYRYAFPNPDQRRVESELYDFRTAPEAGGSFSFALMSDLQLYSPCDRTVHRLGRHPIDFILFSGDAVNDIWRASDWFNLPEAEKDEKTDLAFFTVMQRHDDGIRLMQYMPFFCCPGNHEIDDMRFSWDKKWAVRRNEYAWTIYMQLFRTYYPEQEYGLNGKHWFSLDYADLHITSLLVSRHVGWEPSEAPGMMLVNDIEKGSPQADWLENDLRSSSARFKWIIMHWHMMNRGSDTQPFLCQPQTDPANPARMIYPTDTVGEFLHPLFRETGVNGVSYGHSHVYERYLIDGVNYIEAAYFGVKYGYPDGPVNPSGILPVNQQHDFRSYMIVSCDGEHLVGRGYQAAVEPNGYGYEGRLFDRFDIV